MKFWSTFSNVMEIVHFPSTFKRWCCFFQVVDFFLFNFATSFFILRWLWYVMPSVRSLRARGLLSLGGKAPKKRKKGGLGLVSPPRRRRPTWVDWVGKKIWQTKVKLINFLGVRNFLFSAENRMPMKVETKVGSVRVWW